MGLVGSAALVVGAVGTKGCEIVEGLALRLLEAVDDVVVVVVEDDPPASFTRPTGILMLRLCTASGTPCRKYTRPSKQPVTAIASSTACTVRMSKKKKNEKGDKNIK
jgi:hypothetical protein